MPDAAVWPELSTVQDIDAAVVPTVGDTELHAVNDRAAGVSTTRLNDAEVPTPLLGVRVRLPAYAPALVGVVTVAAPQLLVLAAQVDGPDAVTPETEDAYAMLDAAV